MYILVSWNAAVCWALWKTFQPFCGEEPKTQNRLCFRKEDRKSSSLPVQLKEQLQEIFFGGAFFLCVTAGKYGSGKDEQLLAKEEAALKKAKPKQRIGSTLQRLGSIVQASLAFLFHGILKHFFVFN